MFSTGNISPNYSVTIDSTSPRPRDPYEAFLCDNLHRAHYGTSSHVEAISHPDTLRSQRQDVYLKLLPQSLCIRVKELCRDSAAQLAKGRNDCATLFRCAGDGNCTTHALWKLYDSRTMETVRLTHYGNCTTHSSGVQGMETEAGQEPGEIRQANITYLVPYASKTFVLC